MLKRALGYTIQIEEDKLDRDGCPHTLQKDVHIPGDVTAMIFWLRNRKPDKWGDRPREKDNPNTLNDSLINVAQLINNPKPVRTEESLEEKEGDSDE